MMNMELRQILEAIGYVHSSEHWRGFEENASNPVNIDGVVGCYVYRTSPDNVTPPRPAVYVAEAQDESHGREIHRKLWNRGDCPFLILILPTQIRIYSGFRYETDKSKEDSPLFKEIVRTAGSLERNLQSSILKSFSADAIDSGRIWKEYGNYLTASERVDKNLLRNLQGLSLRLQQAPYHVSQETAHSLIGKYIYFRYLKDRRILTQEWLQANGISEDSIFGRQATLQGFERLFESLQQRFNGEIFAFTNPPRLTDTIIQFVASVFIGDNPSSGQMALDFGAYDFECLPVELLSSIYEQFLHEKNTTEDKDRGGDAGAYYTPKPLADYVLAELEAACPLKSMSKVFDPSCGSGVFLVLAYQRLIALRQKEAGRRLTAAELRDILTTSIFGVEISQEACSITEFSLLLTLLSHLEPPDLHQNQTFHFPLLRDSNIFNMNFFAANNLVFQKGLRFDWIAGNPPWIGYSYKKNKDIEKENERICALAYIDEAKKQGRPIGDLRACEAFCWRASDLLTKSGHAALLIHATTLVNATSQDFRRAFFYEMTVKHITNFSNLAYILFESPDAPAALVIYTRTNELRVKPPIVHFAPFFINQKPLQKTKNKDGAWTITINENEIQWVQPEDAEKDEHNLWKACLWGTYHDRRTLQRLRRLLPTTVNNELVRMQFQPASKGLELKSLSSRSDNKMEYEEPPYKYILDVAFLNNVKRRNRHPVLTIPAEAIKPLDMSNLYVDAGQTKAFLYQSPHLFISASFASYSEVDFVIPNPQVGISCNNSDFLKSLCLFLNSNIARYLMFFSSGQWGVTVSILSPSNVGICPFQKLDDNAIKQLASEFDRLSQLENSLENDAEINLLSTPQADLDLQREIDLAIQEALHIPVWITTIAREFMQTRYQLNKGKMGTEGRLGLEIESISPRATVTEAQLLAYGEHLRGELDSFAQMAHKISIVRETDTIMTTVEITEEQGPLPVEITSSPTNDTSSLMRAIRQRRSQWIYVQRSIRYFEGKNRVHIIKANQFLDWTLTQAFLDAGDVIGSALAGDK